jgi:hypothetical protein
MKGSSSVSSSAPKELSPSFIIPLIEKYPGGIFGGCTFKLEPDGVMCRICQHVYKHQKGPGGAFITSCAKVTRDSILQQHVDSDTHKVAIARFDENIHSSVTRTWALDLVAEETVVIKRLKAIYYCAKQNFANSSVPLLNVLIADCNKDTPLAQMPYLSSSSISEMLILIGKHVHSRLLTSLQMAHHFSVMVDDATDISNVGQMITVVRFAAPTGEPNTAFLDIRPLGKQGGTGENIFTLFTTMLKEYKLQLDNLVGVSCDGASAMLGRKQGFASRLQELMPYLIIVHCLAHRLALSCKDAMQDTALADADNWIDTAFSFFRKSPLRTAHLVATAADLDSDRFLLLKRPCPTRWLSTDAAVEAIVADLPALWKTLADMPTDATAVGLLSKMKTKRFVRALYTFHTVLPHLAHFSRELQADSLNFSDIAPAVQSCCRRLQLIQSENQVLERLRADWNKFEFELGVLDVQEEKCITELTGKYVVATVAAIHDRVGDTAVLKPFDILNPQRIRASNATDPHFGEPEVKLLFLRYKHLMKRNERAALTEWQHFCDQFGDVHPHVNSGTQLCKAVITMPNAMTVNPFLTTIAQIALTLPFSTACAERGFSSMGRIKSIARNRLSEDTLQHLMTIVLNGPTMLPDADFKMIFEKWKDSKVRRLVGARGYFPPNYHQFPFYVHPLGNPETPPTAAPTGAAAASPAASPARTPTTPLPTDLGDAAAPPPATSPALTPTTPLPTDLGDAVAPPPAASPALTPTTILPADLSDSAENELRALKKPLKLRRLDFWFH